MSFLPVGLGADLSGSEAWFGTGVGGSIPGPARVAETEEGGGDANEDDTRTAAELRTWASPCGVRGRSVWDVKRPLRVQAVSPWRTRKTRGVAASLSGMLWWVGWPGGRRCFRVVGRSSGLDTVVVWGGACAPGILCLWGETAGCGWSWGRKGCCWWVGLAVGVGAVVGSRVQGNGDGRAGLAPRAVRGYGARDGLGFRRGGETSGWRLGSPLSCVSAFKAIPRVILRTMHARRTIGTLWRLVSTKIVSSFHWLHELKLSFARRAHSLRLICWPALLAGLQEYLEYIQ